MNYLRKLVVSSARLTNASTIDKHFTRSFRKESKPKFVIYRPQLPIKRVIEAGRRSEFHSSHPRNALPPMFWFIVRPLLKIGSIILGRGLRKWWQTLPPNKQQLLLETLRRKKNIILGSCTAVAGLSGAYYYMHLVEDPITKRKRFIIFSREQLMQLTDLEIETKVEEFKNDMIPVYHPSYRYVENIVERLLAGNQDIEQVRKSKWTITVVNNPRVEAFVYPNGHIFVFGGIIKACSNEDQLGAVLGHEMAHAILGHSGEMLSNTHIVEMSFIIPLTILWTIFPDTAAFLFQLVTSYLLNLLFELPYSRSLEMEADEIGLQLAAKACFDVREASAFWDKVSKLDDEKSPPEFLSTHPSHESRKQYLDTVIPSAIELRKLCKCPDLKTFWRR